MSDTFIPGYFVNVGIIKTTLNKRIITINLLLQ